MLKYGFNYAVVFQDNKGFLHDIQTLNGYETLVEELWNTDTMTEVESVVSYYNTMNHVRLLVFPLD